MIPTSLAAENERTDSTVHTDQCYSSLDINTQSASLYSRIKWDSRLFGALTALIWQQSQKSSLGEGSTGICLVVCRSLIDDVLIMGPIEESTEPLSTAARVPSTAWKFCEGKLILQNPCSLRGLLQPSSESTAFYSWEYLHRRSIIGHVLNIVSEFSHFVWLEGLFIRVHMIKSEQQLQPLCSVTAAMHTGVLLARFVLTVLICWFRGVFTLPRYMLSWI